MREGYPHREPSKTDPEDMHDSRSSTTEAANVPWQVANADRLHPSLIREKPPRWSERQLREALEVYRASTQFEKKYYELKSYVAGRLETSGGDLSAADEDVLGHWHSDVQDIIWPQCIGRLAAAEISEDEYGAWMVAAQKNSGIEPWSTGW